jgi:hypothetical protein
MNENVLTEDQFEEALRAAYDAVGGKPFPDTIMVPGTKRQLLHRVARAGKVPSPIAEEVDGVRYLDRITTPNRRERRRSAARRRRAR